MSSVPSFWGSSVKKHIVQQLWPLEGPCGAAVPMDQMDGWVARPPGSCSVVCLHCRHGWQMKEEVDYACRQEWSRRDGKDTLETGLEFKIIQTSWMKWETAPRMEVKFKLGITAGRCVSSGGTDCSSPVRGERGSRSGLSSRKDQGQQQTWGNAAVVIWCIWTALHHRTNGPLPSLAWEIAEEWC